MPQEPPARPRDDAPTTGALQRRGWLITATYAVFSALWIYGSDRALDLVFDDPDRLVRWSVYKGLAFVATTSLLLFLLVQWLLGLVRQGYRKYQANERELQRMQRLYAALSQINQSILFARDRGELLVKICGNLVEFGGFKMAWIGWHEPGTHRILPLASWGDDENYLKSISIYTDDRPEGLGPTGRAFREETPYISNDLLNDPNTLPWREQARRRNFRASACFPIRLGGKTIGTLSVYADEAGFFQDREVELLLEAAADISFGLDNLQREEDRRAAERSLHSEQGFSRTMIESMPGILYFYDQQGKFIRWNRNFETASGYSGEEIGRMHPLDFFPQAQHSSLKERISEVFTGGESSIEAPFLSKDGTTTPYFFTGRRVEFQGQPCLVGVGINISQRIAAETELKKSEERYRSTLDNILEGCQLLDFNWRYLYLNGAAARQNRRPNHELLGRTITEVWPGVENLPLYVMLRTCMEQRIPVHEEIEFTFPDGHRGWFDLRVQPVPEGIFMLSIEITERHAAEMALRELNESLERRISERTSELKEALERAEAADRIKSAFLATMSHELRTPLNSIIGFTGIVLQGLAGPLNAEQSKQLGMVRSSARHLLDLINDVLDISKIEAGQLEVQQEEFDLTAVLNKTIELLRHQAATKGLALELRADPRLGVIRSDRRRVEQILINLLNNAVKFTETGRIVMTAARVDGPDGPRVRVDVEDTGIGITPEDLDTLFQPFRQVESGLTRHHEGTGLGLAICRRLATLLGGTVTATSIPGRGSVFTLTLPLTPGPRP